MRKWTTVILLLFLAIIVGTGIWYIFQKDYHPALKESQGGNVMQMPKKQLLTEQMSVQQIPKEQISEENVSSDRLIEYNDWGVVLSAENVTPDGMTLVCTQSGGSPSGELNTGAWYELEKKIDGKWIPSEKFAEVCWEDIAWNIPMEGRVEWDVNWTWIYGSLKSGEYRLVKELMDFRKAGDYDTCKSYAYFIIE
ncbi:MAG: hypothetical protein E7289_00830 [Lachnospiraceae bacterium]|nr:hypothetical protein [Lachnospiraceae bacterium]